MRFPTSIGPARMATSSLASMENATNVALIGTNGFIGGALLEEAVRRGRRLRTYVAGFESIRAATRAAGVPRPLRVGGAASLQVAPGDERRDTPQFPAQWRCTARGAREALVRADDDVLTGPTHVPGGGPSRSDPAALKPRRRSARGGTG